MPEVMTIGNLLVEVMRSAVDQPLDDVAPFVGPYPSGDVAIYADAVARLGRGVGIVGAVGRDAFGDCIVARLRSDGVDCRAVHILDDYATGVAFVAYMGDGSRRFLFHWRHAAAGQLAPIHVAPSLFADCRWLHLTGCNLAVSDAARAACEAALALLPSGAIVSFDPNIRPELLSAAQIRALCRPILERADVVLPSQSEAAMLTDAPNDEVGCRQWAAQGKTVVLKGGASGCRVFRGDDIWQVSGFAVDEIDPTGAGDVFCAGFSVALLDGLALPDAARFANAAGACAVTRRGPMEGTPTRAEVMRMVR